MLGRKNRICCVLCKRNVYFHNEHIQYIIFEHKKCNMHSNYSNVQYKSYCILKYKKKMVTKLWSNPLWSLSRQCDESFFKLTDDMSVKSLTAMSPMTSLSLFLPKRCKKMWQHLNTYMIDITVHILCTASMVFPICQDSQRTLVFHISKSTNEFKVLATPEDELI